MKHILMALLAFTTTKSFATEIYCRSSSSLHIQISPESKSVKVFQFGKIADQFTISEIIQKQSQMIYKLEDGYSVFVTLRKNTKPESSLAAQMIGDGYAERNGMKAAAYQFCSAD